MPATEPTPRQLRIALAFTATVLLAMLFLQLLDPEFNGDDFLAMYAAGSLVHQGHGAQLYDLQAQARMEAPLVKHQGLVLIVHPPFEAVAFAPFTALPFAAAYILWGVVNILLWLLFAHLARRFAPVPRQPFRYLLLCFGFLPLWLALMKGQTISLLIVLYCLTFLSLQKGHDFRAGAFLGLGLFRFQLVLPFALVCLLRKKWRMVAGFGAVAILLALASLPAGGPSGVLSYFRLLHYVIKHPVIPGYRAISPSDMASLRGLFSALLAGSRGEKWTPAAVALASFLLIVFTAWRWRQHDRDEGGGSAGLAFAATLAVTQLTAFHLYLYDLSLIVPAALLVFASPQWSQKSAWRTVLTASLGILYFPPVYFLLRNWDRRYLLVIPLAGFAVAAFGLLEKRPVEAGESGA